MLHEPVSQQGEDNAVGYKTKLGVIMFVIYACIYIGFVLINVINPLLMEAEIMLGLNLAVVYGFFLIIFALILAVIYNQLCTNKEKELNPKKGGEK